jgi:hypothetical protein
MLNALPNRAHYFHVNLLIHPDKCHGCEDLYSDAIKRLTVSFEYWAAFVEKYKKEETDLAAVQDVYDEYKMAMKEASVWNNYEPLVFANLSYERMRQNNFTKIAELLQPISLPQIHYR